MIRDFLKDEKYFDEFLRYENERIEKFNTAINTVINQRGTEDEGVQRTYISISGFYFNKLRAMYSYGCSLEEIKALLPEAIDVMEKSWKPESGYVQMVWMLSIGIMLDMNDDQFEKLNNLVKGHSVQDFLINFLINSRNKTEWKVVDVKLLHEVPYAKLIEVIKCEDKDLSVIRLKEYLRLEWYEGHNDTGWYESHKNKNDIYCGYWSFESGAIAKILQLDDRILKGIPYYPYDMVHYQVN